MAEREQDTNTGSTGGLGLEPRSFHRLYLNWRFGVVHDLESLERFTRRGIEAIQRHTLDAERCVARVLVGESLLHQVAESPIVSSLLEAAVPTTINCTNKHGDIEQLWMLMGAVNNPRRQHLHPVEMIINHVESARVNSGKTPLQRVQELRSHGYRFIQDIPTDRIDDVLRLWGETFDWNSKGVIDLQTRLLNDGRIRSTDRGAWFTGLIDPDSNELITVATAERLNLPIGDGRTLPIVESTEWRRSDDIRRHGLMAATISHLNGQILNDLDHHSPIIIAETNFSSEAHRVGFAAGMDVAPRKNGTGFIPQILIQNVEVVDGFNPKGLRDFTMMYLPPESIDRLYSPELRKQILEEERV